MKTQQAIRATVSGRVQGVGFRYATVRLAEQEGVTGWVRNLATGGVEVFAQGDAEAVDRMSSWLASGPLGARVERVDVSSVPPDPSVHRFEVRFG